MVPSCPHDRTGDDRMNSTALPTMYEALGGVGAVRALVNRFYDIMDGDPALAPLRAMHAADLSPMRDKLTDWMTAFLGGPQHYFERPDADRKSVV